MPPRSQHLTSWVITVACLLWLGIAAMFMVQLFKDLSQTHASTKHYHSDFFFDYLVARHTRTGGKPYDSLVDIKRKLFPEDQLDVFDHPSPHPPSVIPLIIPFSLLEYERSALVWLCLTLALLAWTAVKLAKLISKDTGVLHYALILSFLLTAAPFYYDLVLGQWNVVLLFLTLLLLESSNKGMDHRAGIALGLLLSIKFFGVLFALYFLLKRRWKVLGICVAVFAVLNLITGFTVSFDSIVYYFTSVAPEVARFTETDVRNQSLWTLGQRLFVGMSPGPAVALGAAPLSYVPQLAKPFSAIIVTALSLASLVYALKFKDERYSLALLCGANVLISPVTWIHSTGLAILPLALCVAALRTQGKPKLQLAALGTLLTMFFISNRLNPFLFGSERDLTFITSLPTMGSLLCVLGTIALLAHCFLVTEAHASLAIDIEDLDH